MNKKTTEEIIQSNNEKLAPLGLKSGKPFTSEKARECQKIATENRNKKKTIAEILNIWCELKPAEKSAEYLRKMGFEGELTNKALLVAPLIKQCMNGDAKAIGLVIDLLGESKAKELEMKKLQADITRLELQQEVLIKELKGVSEEDKIILFNDVPITDDIKRDKA